MNQTDHSNDLIRHGLLIFIVSLLVGAAVHAFTNPRMALAAHVGGVTTGTFVAVVGLVWSRASLPGPSASRLFFTTLYGAWGTVVALVWAAVFGTSRSTPMAGAGHAGSAFTEGVADVLLATSSLAILVASVWLWRRIGAE